MHLTPRVRNKRPALLSLGPNVMGLDENLRMPQARVAREPEMQIARDWPEVSRYRSMLAECELEST